MTIKNLKLNRAVNFRANEDLYYDFALKCKLNKQKIGDRLNALMFADLQDNSTHPSTADKDLFSSTKSDHEDPTSVCKDN